MANKLVKWKNDCITNVFSNSNIGWETENTTLHVYKKEVSGHSARESNRPGIFRPNFEVISPDVFVVLSMRCVEFFNMYLK